MMPVSAVIPGPSAAARRRPIGLTGIAVTGGLWADRLRRNREVSLIHGERQLEAAGNFANLRAAASGGGEYAGEADDSGLTFPFLDSDVYKWLEAIGWEAARGSDPELMRLADRAIDLVGAAQREDGYLNSYFQITSPGRPFIDLEWGHELYTIGHLVQAAVAWKRSLDDERLLAIAERAVDRIAVELGPGRRELIDGHPQIEMALVELYRTTGEERHLSLAATLIERRGRGLLRPDRFGPEYWQDHESVRSAREPAGHAVRQLYLDSGAVDLAVETDDAELLAAVIRRWEVMVASRTYLTGGLGARQRDEAFGDAYELPPDVAYAETCAAIASVMLAWRLLLATGEQRYADLIERTSLNGLLSGLGLDGMSYFYANPLHVRRADGEGTRGPTSTRRRPWYPCACCPPNLMRFLATYPDLVASVDPAGVAIHQFVPATIDVDAAFGHVRLELRTEYPWDGAVDVRVVDAPGGEWTLSARVPAWCRAGSVTVGADVSPIASDTGEISLTRPWRPGDEVRIALDVPARLTMPDPRIDAIRGTVAVERGPLVYAVEEVDLPAGATLDTIEADPATPPSLAAPDPELPGLTLVDVAVSVRDPDPADGWPYRSAAPQAEARSTTVRAIPYFAWGNRGPGGMRVWVPRPD
jgi:DUF1680 family protein